MTSEYAPPPPKVRVTKAQLRKIQQNYQEAEKLAENNSEKEAQEKLREVAKLEEKIDDVF